MGSNRLVVASCRLHDRIACEGEPGLRSDEVDAAEEKTGRDCNDGVVPGQACKQAVNEDASDSRASRGLTPRLVVVHSAAVPQS